MPRVLSAALVAVLGVAVVSACGDRAPAETTSLAALVGDERIVVLGELHGTNEFPAAVGDAAEEVARSSSGLTVALEWPRDDQSLVDTYLASEGSSGDRAALLSSPFWAFTDGRTSTSMLGLLERLRRLRDGGGEVHVVLFDIGRDLRLPPQELARERDRLMAELLTEVARRDQRPVLVLVGNQHAKKSGNEPPSMADHLVRNGVDVVALNAVHGGGTAWVCTTDGCGERSMPGRHLADTPFLAIGGDSEGDGYDGVLYVPAITAAPPAKAG